tara:strand:+ start:645 stop:1151 length:507 start_codon:yes stop_codon:yes gene_type:complete
MKKDNFIILFALFFLVLFLSGCSVTVHRELKHQNFAVKYPNWGNYKLEKYDDQTFKATTSNSQNTCQVLVSAYSLGYLPITKIILDTVEESSIYTLLEKDITHNTANLLYTIRESKNEQVKISILQCGDFSYVTQYTCDIEVYPKKQSDVLKVVNSMKCTAPLESLFY